MTAPKPDLVAIRDSLAAQYMHEHSGGSSLDWPSALKDLTALLAYAERLEKEIEEINTPEIKDFTTAVEREAKHQRARWGSDHDAGKTDADWFWLIGYLAGKALHAQSDEKRLHHIITTAAACLNWHSARLGTHTRMRPGIDGEKALGSEHGG